MNGLLLTTHIVDIKSDREIIVVRQAAKIVSQILAETKLNIKPGITTQELEEIICEKIRKYNCEPAFKGYRGYPACSCISVDDELVHGIPKWTKKIKKGQLVKIDIGVKYNGFYADAATTVYIDDPKINKTERKEILRLLETTYNSIYEVLPFIRDGCKVGDIGYHVQKYVESQGFSVIREYVGHTTGRKLHEKPDIPNYGEKGEGETLVSNMVICLEPMVSVGSWETVVDSDGWTVKMKDGSLCAHYEHMVLVGYERSEIITDPDVIKPEVI
ncbi:MAG: type I methionyl aminopeptidase [Endomicrobia bacterium]|nr:type I methionyl aminopeptidase [Endomicrobiia bacterium]MDW8055485.1 type I methionyl aminopeptidase [Elusimicrobiota bacterium]